MMVEIYLQVLTLSVYPNLKEIKCRKFSRSDTIGEYSRTSLIRIEPDLIGLLTDVIN